MKRLRVVWIIIMLMQSYIMFSQRVVNDFMKKEQSVWRSSFMKQSYKRAKREIRKKSTDTRMIDEAVAALYNLRRAAYTNNFYYGSHNYWSQIEEQTGKKVLLHFLDINEVVGTYQLPTFYKRNRVMRKKQIIELYQTYGTITVFSWHIENPYTPLDWKDPKYGRAAYRFRYTYKEYPQEHRYVIHEILNNEGDSCGFVNNNNSTERIGYHNPRAWYDSMLSQLSSFLKELKTDDGKPIPVVIRPLHECEDDWQWWGRGSVSPSDFIEFYRYTEKTIKKLSGLHNLIFAWSPDRYWDNIGVEDEKDYMLRYPGDEYVDMIGFDDYSIGINTNMEAAKHETIRKIQLVTYEAEKREKACGLFETGLFGGNKNPDAFYDILYEIMKTDGCRFGFVNIWGNYTVPSTEYGKARWINFINQPSVWTFDNGRDLTKFKQDD